MANAINWFELPAVDFDRAVSFYNQVMGTTLQPFDGEFKMAFFPTSGEGVGGCVTHGNGNKPNQEGALVYLNGGEDLALPLSKVESAGGSVLMPKTSIGENGFMAIFLDSEGNRVAFHSMN
ncbi:MAG: VOC family protein [Saprospiraceae bacterium]